MLYARCVVPHRILHWAKRPATCTYLIALLRVPGHPPLVCTAPSVLPGDTTGLPKNVRCGRLGANGARNRYLAWVLESNGTEDALKRDQGFRGAAGQTIPITSPSFA